MLNLNDTQEGVLNLVFKIADDRGMLLLDLKDLRAMLQYVGDNAKEFTTEYGNVSAASIGAIQRGLMQIEQQGGDKFFGEPMLDIHDFMQTDGNGHGVVNILAADKLMNSPRLYATFLLWMLSELFEQLPEVGDPDKPKLVFFFDEAHLLFNEAPKALDRAYRTGGASGALQRCGCVFRHPKSAGHPRQRAGANWATGCNMCCAFTPRDQKAVAATAQTMRPKQGLDIEAAITELGRGRGAGELARRPKAAPAKPSGCLCCRLAVSWDLSALRNAKPCCKAPWWPACMKKPWTANRPTK
jgi:hypothetical protein